MSCGCNSSPCNCQPRPSVCCTPTTESVEYTFENGNLIGVGVFDNDTDNLVQFRGLYSDNASLVISLDAPNNAIHFAFDPDALITDIPDATTTQRGIGETATNAEAQAKAAADKFLTPSNLAALGGSTTFAGMLELATDAETIAGVSTTLAVTPAGLAAVGATNTTTTWADAAARAGAVPHFAGQFGTQLDTDVPWISRSTIAGGFDTPILVGRGQNTIAANMLMSLGGFDITFYAGSVSFDSTSVAVDAGTMTFGGTSTSVIDFNDVLFHIAGGAMGDQTLLGSSTAFGAAAEFDIASFLSVFNPQTGYTNFANGATLRTCDTATVTLQQLAQIVGTLINDLKAVKLPQT